MFPQVIGDPGDALRRDHEIGRRPPEAARVVFPKEFARFANAHHGARLIGGEAAATLAAAEASGIGGTHGLAHDQNVSAYDEFAMRL